MKIVIYLKDKIEALDTEIKVTSTEDRRLLVEGVDGKLNVDPMELYRAIKIIFDDLFTREGY